MNESMIIAMLVGILVVLIWFFIELLKDSRRIDLSQRLEGRPVGSDGMVENAEETLGEKMAQIGVTPFVLAIAVFVIVFAVVYGSLQYLG